MDDIIEIVDSDATEDELDEDSSKDKVMHIDAWHGQPIPSTISISRVAHAASIHQWSALEPDAIAEKLLVRSPSLDTHTFTVPSRRIYRTFLIA